MSNSNMLKVLIVATEMSPFIASGGLGEVIGSLPKSLRKNNIDVRVIIPKYKNINKSLLNDFNFTTNINVALENNCFETNIYSQQKDNYTIYFVENDYFFNREELYGYYDDYKRFAYFSKAVLEALPHIDFKPDVLHINDWQTSLCSVYMHKYYKNSSFYKDIKTLLTLHNMQYQGIYSRDVLKHIGLDDSYYHMESLEFHGNINYLKGGLIYSDAISTVSPTYAKEIQHKDFAYGLEGILQKRKKDIYGILNGVEMNSPFNNFEDNLINKKKETKKLLQRKLGLKIREDVPLIAIVSRLVNQKGLDLINFDFFNRDMQLVVLGTGEGHLENFFKNLQELHPTKISANIFYEKNLADEIYLGADMFLMPSVFEPCGLGQIFALQNATIPIVRSTGGLKDTIEHYNYNNKIGNGFVFEHNISSGLLWALDEAIKCYHNKDHWCNVLQNAVHSNFSWDKSSLEYIKLYKQLLDETK